MKKGKNSMPKSGFEPFFFFKENIIERERREKINFLQKKSTNAIIKLKNLIFFVQLEYFPQAFIKKIQIQILLLIIILLIISIIIKQLINRLNK